MKLSDLVVQSFVESYQCMRPKCKAKLQQFVKNLILNTFVLGNFCIKSWHMIRKESFNGIGKRKYKYVVVLTVEPDTKILY